MLDLGPLYKVKVTKITQIKVTKRIQLLLQSSPSISVHLHPSLNLQLPFSFYWTEASLACQESKLVLTGVII